MFSNILSNLSLKKGFFLFLFPWEILKHCILLLVHVTCGSTLTLMHTMCVFITLASPVNMCVGRGIILGFIGQSLDDLAWIISTYCFCQTLSDCALDGYPVRLIMVQFPKYLIKTKQWQHLYVHIQCCEFSTRCNA